jgi:GH43 family beta-xylosidase
MKTMQALFRLARTLTLALVLLPGSHAVAGEATFTNPLNDSGPDPWMTWYEGHYYLAATTWGEADVGLTMRKARTIEELKNAEPVQIWQDDTADRCCNFWAPEFFLLDGPNGPRWYGYFTGGASGTDFVQTQFMHVIESAGTDPMGPYSYKGKLVERNALDGSVLQLNGKLYAIYSVWNETQDLAIKEMSNPWTTVGEETTLARPELPWERQDGTVLEGPVALQRDGRTFIVYAASACWGPNYKLGMLTWQGGDPLLAASWAKSPEPLFQRADERGVFAPGHNTFFKSPDGTEDWMAYHANDLESDVCDMGRTPRIQKFGWKEDGTPDFGIPVAAGTALEVPSEVQP